MARVWYSLVTAALLAVGCSTCADEAAPTTGGGASADAAAAGEAGAPTGAAGPTDGGAATDAALPGAFTLTSTAFVEGGDIPRAHAKCPSGSANQSPPLAWANAPAGTQSYAVVMRDLDVNPPDNYHWVIWNIPSTTTSLPAGIPAQAVPGSPPGARQTYWSFGSEYSYQGPCPPKRHAYRFTVYAFATPTLSVPDGETSPKSADAIIQAQKAASASLTGTYAQ